MDINVQIKSITNYRNSLGCSKFMNFFMHDFDDILML